MWLSTNISIHWNGCSSVETKLCHGCCSIDCHFSALIIQGLSALNFADEWMHMYFLQIFNPFSVNNATQRRAPSKFYPAPVLRMVINLSVQSPTFTNISHNHPLDGRWAHIMESFHVRISTWCFSFSIIINHFLRIHCFLAEDQLFPSIHDFHNSFFFEKRRLFLLDSWQFMAPFHDKSFIINSANRLEATFVVVSRYNIKSAPGFNMDWIRV